MFKTGDKVTVSFPFSDRIAEGVIVTPEWTAKTARGKVQMVKVRFANCCGPIPVVQVKAA